MATMPNPVEPLTDAEKQNVTAPDEQWSDGFALKISKSDFESAETFKQNYHDWRLRNADEIYKAWMPQRYWPGTKQPRSSLGIYLALQQIEALLPHVIGNLFADELFEIDPPPGWPEPFRKVADACQNIETQQLQKAKIEKVFHLAMKSAAIYGNGVFELYWEHREQPRWLPRIAYQPVMRSVLEMDGSKRDVLVGRKRVFEMQKDIEKISRPMLRNHSIWDVYPDPNCPTPVIQDGRFFCVRKFMTIGEIKAMANIPGFRVPPDALLVELAKNKPATLSDTMKTSASAVRGEWWNPRDDYSADPNQQRIEVIEYTTPERKVQMLNRLWTFYNQPNPYGFINFYSFWYCDVLDRWYSIGVCDLLDSEQRLQQSIVNSRIDELALAIHPSTIKRRAGNVSQSMLLRRPGGVIETANGPEDIQREEVPNITQSAYVEVGASETRSQKYTGLTDFAGIGVAPSQGNSGARTATGSSIMANAQANRINYMVKISEYAVIEPMLYNLHEMNRRFLDPETPLYTSAGERVDPMMLKAMEVEYVVRASARMQSRQFMLQVYPLVAQTFLNPAFMEQLARANGMKVNVAELGRALQDLSGYRQRWGEFFLPLTPQEQQALSQPSPDEQLRADMQRDRIEGQRDIAQEKHAADMMHTIVEKTADALMAERDDGEDSGGEAGGGSASEE